MISSQLGRTLLGRSSSSADAQKAKPEDRGSYGGLMDAIDEAIRSLEDEAGRGGRAAE